MDEFAEFLRIRYGIDMERYLLLPANEQEVIDADFKYQTSNVWKGVTLEYFESKQRCISLFR